MVAGQLGEQPAQRITDTRFHTLIAELSRSASLLRHETEIQLQLNALILSRPALKVYGPLLVGSHKPIMQAIAQRDGNRALQAMIAHAESTFDWCAGLVSLDP